MRSRDRGTACAAVAMALLACGLLGGLARAADLPPCIEKKPFAASGTPINIELLTDYLKDWYYRCDYAAEVETVLDAARSWIAEAAPRVSKAAIVLDIDETSLSNWAQLSHNNFAFVASGACDLASGSACGQREWELSAKSTAIAPTLALFNAAKGIKDKNGNPVTLFFITGRHDDPFERAATEYNLRKTGYDGWKELFMRPDPPPGEPVSDYKTAKRQLIENSDGYKYTIVANIGDQISDLEGILDGEYYAKRCFKVPNPFYYIPGRLKPDDKKPRCLDP